MTDDSLNFSSSRHDRSDPVMITDALADVRVK